METENTLYYGDNLTIMQRMKKHSVDLIYLDPPFNSKKNYNLMYKTLTGKPVSEQVEAFCDTWEMDAEKEELAKTMPNLMQEVGVEDYYIQFWRLWITALSSTQPHLLAYLIYMVQRLLWMKSLLRPAGSIYLHCDPTASHYIKIMMDGIFGHKNFQNEIVWKRTGAHGTARKWGPVHDTILFYSASPKYTWNKTFQEYETGYIEDKYRHKDGRGVFQDVSLTGPGITKGESGQPWRAFNPTEKGRHWAIPGAIGEAIPGFAEMSTFGKLDALDAAGAVYWPKGRSGSDGFPRVKQYPGLGNQVQDVITDIAAINSQAQERLGYPTQKPVALLERIIQASTNKGDVVFDPFCGCGTTIFAAARQERKWIGCDIAILSIQLIRDLLCGDQYRLVEGQNFSVTGIPVSVEQAHALFLESPSQFQHWLVERAGGFPMQKKVADHGIDGRMYFETMEGLKSMVLSVKGGGIKPADLRDLRGVLERESEAEMAGFLCLKEPTKAMIGEAASAGQYQYAGTAYDRMQILTVKDILEEKRQFDTPTKMGTRVATRQTAIPL
jgi:DNA modification methylase